MRFSFSSFATRERNGLLLYNGRYNERHDFIALELIDGRLQFSFSLGANLTRVVLEQAQSLADGSWHTVIVDYVNRVGYLEKENVFNNMTMILKFLIPPYLTVFLKSRLFFPPER